MTATLIHADLRHFLRSHRGGNKTQILSELIAEIQVEALGDLWMPAFNYGFSRGEDFRVAYTPSQSGVLSEYFRLQLSTWRTHVPIFSIAGTGPQPEVATDGPVLLAFGPCSAYAVLVANEGLVLNVGCDLRFLTLAHYAEVADGFPVLYRYDKDFAGVIELVDGSCTEVIVRYHVTLPTNRITYDWSLVQQRMAAAGALREIHKFGGGSLIDAPRFVDEWQRLARVDPFWPLSAESRIWVQPMSERLGRRFVQSDFEAAE